MTLQLLETHCMMPGRASYHQVLRLQHMHRRRRDRFEIRADFDTKFEFETPPHGGKQASKRGQMMQ